MSSVEIRIKGIKNVKGLKGKRGKAQRKKKALMERQKKAEYIVSQNRPYQYISPIIPTYIDRPTIPALQPPPVLEQPKIEYNPYKMLLDNMLLKMKGDTQQDVAEQMKHSKDIPIYKEDYEEKVEDKIDGGDRKRRKYDEPKVEEVFTEEQIAEREGEKLKNVARQQKLRKEQEKKWFSENKTYEGFSQWWRENKNELFRKENIPISTDKRKKSSGNKLE